MKAPYINVQAMADNQYAQNVFNKFYATAQLLWWAVIFDPEICDWSEDEFRKFGDNMVYQSKHLPHESSRMISMSKGLEKAIGINPEKDAKRVPFLLRTAIWKRMPTKREVLIFNEQSIDGLAAGAFLGLYTLRQSYKMDREQILPMYEAWLGLLEGCRNADPRLIVDMVKSYGIPVEETYGYD